MEENTKYFFFQTQCIYTMLTLSCKNANNYENKQNSYTKLKHKTI